MPVFIGIAANIEANKLGQSVNIIPESYIKAVERTGAVPVILTVSTVPSTIEAQLSRVDGVIIPGGADMDAKYFGQALHPKASLSSPSLDYYQLTLTRLCVEKKIPILGICRGAQVVNVALGGTLVQDIPSILPDSPICHVQKTLSFETDHEVSFSAGSRLLELFGSGIRVNSRHHQSIDAPGRGIRITAKSPDGVVEGAEHESLPIDLVQWHPELLMEKTDTMLPLFEHFTRTCREGN